jgi:hypothetical protein
VAELKDMPGLHLAADLRDPWTWDAGYGWKMLSPGQQREEQAIEAATLPAFERICAPTAGFLTGMLERYPELGKSSVHLPHAIDPDDLAATGEDPKSPVALAVFAGSFYEREATVRFMEGLVQGVRTFLEQGPPPGGRAVVDLYVTSGRPSEAIDLVARAGLQEHIRFKDPIPAAALTAVLKQCCFSLAFLPPHKRAFVPTKFNELLYLRVPLLLVGDPGIAWDHVQQHGMGHCIQVPQLAHELPRYLAGAVPMPRPAAEAAQPFLLERLTDRSDPSNSL